jgi:hypothetical protein
MYVAATDEIYEGPGTSTWKRTYVQQVAPWKVRLATWVVDFTYDPNSWEDWWFMVLRALPATLAMNLVVSADSKRCSTAEADPGTVLGW